MLKWMSAKKIDSLIAGASGGLTAGVAAVVAYLIVANPEIGVKVLQIVIYPCLIIAILYAFRKEFTYMFFSLRKISFFGIQGELRSIEELIQVEADKKLTEMKEKERISELEIQARQAGEANDLARQVEILEEISKIKSESIDILKETKNLLESRLNEYTEKELNIKSQQRALGQILKARTSKTIDTE